MNVTGGGGRGRGGLFSIVRGRSRMTLKLLTHPYNHYAGTAHVGFSPTWQTLPTPNAKRSEMSGPASRMKGELPPTKNRF